MLDYITEATRTESLDKFKVDSPRLLHAVIGINTETTELMEGAYKQDHENCLEEAGDLCWYLAVACSELEVTFEELKSLSVLADEKDGEAVMLAMMVSAGEALNLIKRALFYGVELERVKLAIVLGTFLHTLEVILQHMGTSVPEMQLANITKLRLRYPTEFTTEAAVNRADKLIAGSQD